MQHNCFGKGQVKQKKVQICCLFFEQIWMKIPCWWGWMDTPKLTNVLEMHHVVWMRRLHPMTKHFGTDMFNAICFCFGMFSKSCCWLRHPTNHPKKTVWTNTTSQKQSENIQTKSFETLNSFTPHLLSPLQQQSDNLHLARCMDNRCILTPVLFECICCVCVLAVLILTQQFGHQNHEQIIAPKWFLCWSSCDLKHVGQDFIWFAQIQKHCDNTKIVSKIVQNWCLPCDWNENWFCYLKKKTSKQMTIVFCNDSFDFLCCFGLHPSRLQLFSAIVFCNDSCDFLMLWLASKQVTIVFCNNGSEFLVLWLAHHISLLHCQCVASMSLTCWICSGPIYPAVWFAKHYC